MKDKKDFKIFYEGSYVHLSILKSFKSHQFYICIRGRVVEGAGLIIRFPMEHHWFEPSRMQIHYFNIVFFQI